MNTTTTDLVFACEEASDSIVEEISGLTIRHWIEVGRKDVKFQPVWRMYIKGSSEGWIKLFTVRRNGRLVGYANFIIHMHPHYDGLLSAAQDTMFLEKEERRGRSGIRFIRFCEEQLTESGVKLIQQYSTFKHDFGPVLERMGYEPVSILYERRVGYG